jgi:hypothetical protein
MVMDYRGYHGCPSKCAVRIYEPTIPSEPYVAVYAELAENTGTSVTNAAETIATHVWEFLERPDSEIIFVEHWPDRNRNGSHEPLLNEHWSLTTFNSVRGGFARLQWRRIGKEAVERLTLGIRV